MIVVRLHLGQSSVSPIMDSGASRGSLHLWQLNLIMGILYGFGYIKT